jgi:hypothetical protein
MQSSMPTTSLYETQPFLDRWLLRCVIRIRLVSRANGYKNKAATAVVSEPTFYGIPGQHCFTTALESLAGSPGIGIASNGMVAVIERSYVPMG